MTRNSPKLEKSPSPQHGISNQALQAENDSLREQNQDLILVLDQQCQAEIAYLQQIQNLVEQVGGKNTQIALAHQHHNQATVKPTSDHVTTSISTSVPHNRKLSASVAESISSTHSFPGNRFEFPHSRAAIEEKNTPDDKRHELLLGRIWPRLYDADTGMVDSQDLISTNCYRQGLAILDAHINALVTDPPQTRHEKQTTIQLINAMLLKSAVLLTCEDPARGLETAEKCVTMAWLAKEWDLVCKSQLYRGMCYMALEKFQQAKWCFVRSANVRYFARRVEEWTMFCTRKSFGLPPLRDDTFRTIPRIEEKKYIACDTSVSRGSGYVQH